MELNDQQVEAFDTALDAHARFRRAFGRPLSPDFVAELHVARELSLSVAENTNTPGYDATDFDGAKYQIKLRDAKTQNVDVNNFDFDYLVLVILDDDYRLAELWRMTVNRARDVFVRRKSKFQATQAKVKLASKRIK